MTEPSKENNVGGLYKSLRQAITLSVFSRYATYLVNLALLMVYSRMFTPEEFGVVAIINVFVLFFMVFGEAGLSAGLVNRPETTPKERNGIFSFTLIFGLSVAAAFAGFLYVLNDLYGRDDYQVLGIFAVGSIFLNVAAAVPLAGFLRERWFHRIAIHTIAGELIALVAVVVIWKLGDHLLAIAARPFFVALVSFSLHWYNSAKTALGRPIPGFNVWDISKIYHFSSFLLGFNVVNYFSRNLDNILVGKLLGTGALGIYEKSYAIMKYPLSLLSFAVNPAIQPTITEYRDQPEKVCQVHLMLIGKLSFLAAVISFVIYSHAEQIVYLLLVSQWGDVVPLLQILAFAIPVQAVTACNGGFWQGMGDTRNMFFNGLVGAGIILTAVIGSLWLTPGLIELCIALVVAFHVLFLYSLGRLFRLLYRQSVLRVVKPLLGSLLPFLVAVAAYEYMKIHSEWPALLWSVLVLVVFLPSAKTFLFAKPSIE